MKSIHFDTKKKVNYIKRADINSFIQVIPKTPSVYPGDIVQIKERERDEDKKILDTYLFTAKVTAVIPIQYKKAVLNKPYLMEIAQFGREFHSERWFFVIQFRKEVKQPTLDYFFPPGPVFLPMV